MNKITVDLRDIADLNNAIVGARTCYNSFDKATSERDKALLKRLWNVEKHHSLFEHVVFVFSIRNFSRLALQELVRHRIASYSVKSTRYTLRELRDTNGQINAKDWCVMPDNLALEDAMAIENQLTALRRSLKRGTPNDLAKYLLPESFRTEAVVTMNLRSFMNFYELRSSKHAHFEIRYIAELMMDVLPDNVKEIVNG